MASNTNSTITLIPDNNGQSVITTATQRDASPPLGPFPIHCPFPHSVGCIAGGRIPMSRTHTLVLAAYTGVALPSPTKCEVQQRYSGTTSHACPKRCCVGAVYSTECAVGLLVPSVSGSVFGDLWIRVCGARKNASSVVTSYVCALAWSGWLCSVLCRALSLSRR